MAASTNTQAADLAIWVDGLPSTALQTGTSIPTGYLQFWFDALPYAPIYPATTTTNTSSFMPFFWGI